MLSPPPPDPEPPAWGAPTEPPPEGSPPVRAASPAALTAAPDVDGLDCVLVRLLGGRRAWEEPFDELRRRCLARGIPLLAFGGEAALDAELTAASTVPAAVVAEAFTYLLHGGPANTANLLRFVADGVLGFAFGSEPPVPVPDEGIYSGADLIDPSRPTVAVIFYRAHLLAGHTTFVDDLCAAIRARGANALACWCY